MYKLYYSPGACSMAVHVALNECNQPVTLEKIDLASGQGRTPEFLRINPRGQVPVLVDGDLALRECAAILIHVLEKHQSPLLPQSGPERAAALEWLAYCSATLHPAYSRFFFLKRNVADEAEKNRLMDINLQAVNALWDEVEQRLTQSPYIAGKSVTIADIFLAVIANWESYVQLPIKIGPTTRKLLQQVVARPAYKKALEAEGVAYKVAA